MRVAIIEASHWHCPLYLDAFDDPAIEVVGVSDSSGAKGPAIAARFGARSYAAYADLLARESVDVAFAFGPHAEMPAIAQALIERGIPFALEKPCGTSADAVGRIRRMAAERGIYAAVPFIFRFSELLGAVREAEGDVPAPFHHLSFRFVAGSPQRYPAAGSAWMLDP